jgi:hypothetical protein
MYLPAKSEKNSLSELSRAETSSLDRPTRLAVRSLQPPASTEGFGSITEVLQKSSTTPRTQLLARVCEQRNL